MTDLTPTISNKSPDTRDRLIVQKCDNELSKMKYRIKDYEQVYNISENDFVDSKNSLCSIQESIYEIERAASDKTEFFIEENLQPPTINSDPLLFE